MSTMMRGSIRTTARTTVRAAAVGLGGLALVLGTAACSGGTEETKTPTAKEQPSKDEAPKEEKTEEEKSEEPTKEETSEEATEEETTDSDADKGGGEADSKDVAAAKDRFLSFMKVIAAGDYEKACSYVLDPATNEPASGATLQGCTQGLKGQMENSDLKPGTFDSLDPSMIDAKQDKNGTITMSLNGDDFPLPMVKASDGEWYFSVK